MSDLKDKVMDAGKTVADGAKDAAHFVAEKAGQAADWVKEKTKHETKGDACGSAKSVTDIKPHMDVIASCGCNMGKVDHLEGANAIKLTKKDSSDGQHHFIPTGWVARVDEHVHLSKNAEETMQQWKSEASACAAC